MRSDVEDMGRHVKVYAELLNQIEKAFVFVGSRSLSCDS